jgi:hypothetical protein
VRGILIFLSAAFAVLVLLSPAFAAGDMQNPDRLRGEMFIAGKTLVDPPTDEKRDTHAYMTVSGEAARRLFNTIKAPVKADLCQPGRRFKSVGHLRCSVGAKSADAQCDFSIDLASGTLGAGLVC